MASKAPINLPKKADALLSTVIDSPRLVSFFMTAIALLSGFLVLLFIYTAARRMRYPFDLEWIESGILTSVQRIAQGKQLYVKPSLDFIPYIYAPLFFYLSAALTKITGVTFTTLRLVSTLATLGSFGLIYLSVYKETRRSLAALAAMGLYAGLYATVEGFFDIGRVDALFVFMVLLALFCTRHGHPVLAALVWVLAVQTKQSVLPIALVMLCTDWGHPRRIVIGVATYLSGVAASIALLNHFTHGWYSFYVFGIFGGLGTVWRQVALYIPMYLLTPLSVAFIIIVAALLFTRPRLLSFPASFYLVSSLVLYTGYWYVAAHRGVFNTMMPLYAWTAILFGIALDRLLSRLTLNPSANTHLARLLLLFAVLTQLAMLVYNPGQFIPSSQVRLDRSNFIRQIAALPGDIYVVNHSWDAILAGKQPHAEMEALGLLLDAHTGAIREGLRSDMQAAVDNNRFGAFVVDDQQPHLDASGKGWRPTDFLERYPLAISAVGADHARFLTSQPQWILMPCSGLHGNYINADTYMMESGCADSR